MAAQSPLFSAVATRPLCTLPSSSSSMDQRRFGIDGKPRSGVRDHGMRTSSSGDRGQGDWSQWGADPTVYQQRSSTLPPPPHSLRHQGSFPYSAVARLSQRAESSTTHPRVFRQDDYAPPQRHQQQEGDHQDVHSYHQSAQHERVKHEQTEVWYPRTSSGQYRGRDEVQGLDRDGQFAVGRRGPMPSLDRMLQRSVSADRHAHGGGHDPWRGRDTALAAHGAPHHLVPDESLARHGAPPFPHYGRVYDHDSSSSAGRAGPLPGFRRLSSLTERFSQSQLTSPMRSVSASELAPPSLPLSTMDDRRGVHPAVAQLRSNSTFDSSPVFTASPLRHVHTRPSNWSSPASSRDSPKRSRQAPDDTGDDATADSAAPRKKKKRKTRICTTPGCDKLVVDHGVCIRHGGGKRCNVEGCDCRAQNKGLCWKHGGYTICQVDGCDKRAKSRGMCWSHGGGTQCKTDGCEKIAVSRGRCWAHGGGKRCKLADCQKPAAQRMDDYCNEHYAAYRASAAPPMDA